MTGGVVPADDLPGSAPASASNAVVPTEDLPSTSAEQMNSLRMSQFTGKGDGTTPGGAVNAAATGFNAGVADIAGLPVDTASNVLELGKAALGSLRGPDKEGGFGAFEPNANPESVVGSSAWIKAKMRQYGLGSTIDVAQPTPTNQFIHGTAEMVPSTALDKPASVAASVPQRLASGVAAGAAQTAAGQTGVPGLDVAAGTLAGHAAGMATGGGAPKAPQAAPEATPRPTRDFHISDLPEPVAPANAGARPQVAPAKPASQEAPAAPTIPKDLNTSIRPTMAADGSGQYTPEQRAAINRRAWQAVGMAPNNPADETKGGHIVDQAAYDSAVAAYNAHSETNGGKIISSDIARDMSPDYNLGAPQAGENGGKPVYSDEQKAARSALAAEVHEPSSAFVKQLYADKLAEPVPEGQDKRVVFTAGGTGAGKTSAIAQTPHLADVTDGAHIVYDTNMNTLGSAQQKIDQAMAAGHDVHVAYVYRDPVEAFANGTLPRAERQGRTVPLAEQIRTHGGAYQTVGALNSMYADDPRYSSSTLDNSRGAGKQELIPFSALRGKSYTASADELRAVADKALAGGKISQRVYDGTIGQKASGQGQAARPGQGSGSQPGAPGASAAQRSVGSQVRGGNGQEPPGHQEAGVTDERAGTKPVTAGQRFLALRAGEGTTLSNVNAGNAEAVATHLVRLEDATAPQPSGRGTAPTSIQVHSVEAPSRFSSYQLLNKGNGAAGSKDVGRVDLGNKGVNYSFPAGSAQSTHVATIPLENVRARLKAQGFASFDDAGTKATADAIRAEVAARSQPGKASPIARSAEPVKFAPPAEEGSTQGAGTPADQASRAQLLRDIGLREARTSAISGDTRETGTDYQTAQARNAAGDRMSEVIENERQALRGYADTLAQRAGGEAGLDQISQHAAGRIIGEPFNAFNRQLEQATRAQFAEADRRAGGQPIEMNGLQQFLSKNKSAFLATTDGKQLYEGVQARAKELGLLGANETFNPATVAQAESLRQYVGDAWSPRTSKLVGALKDTIVDDVTKAAGADIYRDARALRALRGKVLEEPKGVAKLMDPEDRLGINREVAYENVPKYVASLPVEQFGHVVDVLKMASKEGLTAQSDAAVKEIRSYFANQVKEAGDSTQGQWNAKKVNQFLAANSARMSKVFTADEMHMFRTLNDAGNALRMDRHYPGAEAQGSHIAKGLGMVAHAPEVLGVHAGGLPGLVVGHSVTRGVTKLSDAALKHAVEKRITRL